MLSHNHPDTSLCCEEDIGGAGTPVRESNPRPERETSRQDIHFKVGDFQDRGIARHPPLAPISERTKQESRKAKAWEDSHRLKVQAFDAVSTSPLADKIRIGVVNTPA
jgi:hypothetical protein